MKSKLILLLILLIPSLAQAQQSGQPSPPSKRQFDDQSEALRLLAPQPVGSSSTRPFPTGIAAGSLAARTVTPDPAGYNVIWSGFLRGNVEPTAYLSSDRKFCGFPSVTRNNVTGRLWLAWHNSPSHNHDTDSVTVLSYSDDGGNTWLGNTRILIDQGAGATDWRMENIYCIPAGPYKGRLLMQGYSDGSGATANSKIAHSDDNGVTWSSARSCYDPNVAFTSYNLGNKPIQLGADQGYALLQAGYGRKTGGVYVATILRSTDGGITWSYLSTALDGTSAGEQPEEPALLRMNNGQILIAIREDVTDTIRTLKSTDNGATWNSIASTAASFAVPGEGKAILHEFDSGAIILSTRAALNQPGTSAQEQVFYVSHDYGSTWGPFQKVDPVTAYYGVYGAFVKVAPNLALFAYGVQHPSSSARGEVRCQYFIDGSGVTPLGGVVADKMRSGNLRAGRLSNAFVSPPVKGSATGDQVLEYMHQMGFPRNPQSVTGFSGLWEADAIPATVNDLNGTFASDTNLARLDGSTASPTVAGGAWQATGGQLQHNTAGSPNKITWDSGLTASTVSADVTYQGSQIWLIFKYVDDSNHMFATIDGSASIIYARVSGSNTNRSAQSTGTGGSFSSGVAKNISATVSSTGLVTVTTGGGLNPVTYQMTAGEITACGAGTRAGFFTSDTTARFDNVVMGSTLAHGDRIGYMPDAGSGARHLFQATTNNKLYYQSEIYGVFNGKPSVRMNGANALATATFGGAQAQPNAVQGVFFFDSAGGGAFDLWSANNASSLEQNLNVATTGIFSLYAGTTAQNVTGGALAVPQPFTYPNGPYLITAMYNGADSFVRVNGRYHYRAHATRRPGSDGLNQFTLGDTNTNPTGYCAGIALYAHGSPTTAELIQAEGYWADKYNVPMAFEGQ